MRKLAWLFLCAPVSRSIALEVVGDGARNFSSSSIGSVRPRPALPALTRLKRGIGGTIVGKRGFRMLGEGCWDDDVWGDSDFHLTRAMCAKTRTHRSWSRAPESVVKKLHEGKCIVVVALGSSQTYGNCKPCWKEELPDRENTTWPGQFKRWLDTKFPCNDAGGHQLHNLAVPAMDTGYWATQVNIMRWNTSHVIHRADLVFTDTAFMDVVCRLDPIDPRRLMPPQGHQSSIIPNTELLIRQLKALPNRPWIVFAEISFGWQQTKGDSHWDAELTHLRVLQHYDVDQVSIIDAFLPLTAAKYAWFRDVFYIDGGHLTFFGHQVLAQVMAHTLMEVSHFMNLPPSENEYITDNTTDDSLPKPVWLGRQLAELYDHGRPIAVMPPDDPFVNSFRRVSFEWNGKQLAATSLDHGVPRIYFQVGLKWDEPRPHSKGYVNLGVRRMGQHGTCKLHYHVMEGACGPDDDASNFKVGLQFQPFWYLLDASLRFSQGFYFALPPTSTACLIMVLEWKGDKADGLPVKFAVDDLTVLA